MSRKYSMLADICNIYHVCYGQLLWFWSAENSMLFIWIHGIQMLLCQVFVMCSFNTWFKLSAEYWSCSTTNMYIVDGSPSFQLPAGWLLGGKQYIINF